MVEFANKPFIYILISILIFNFIFSLFNLLSSNGLIYIFGILVSGGSLYLIYSRNIYILLCIRIWAFIIITTSAASLLSSGCKYIYTSNGGTEYGPESYNFVTIFYHLVLLILGVYCWIYSREYIVLKEDNEEDNK